MLNPKLLIYISLPLLSPLVTISLFAISMSLFLLQVGSFVSTFLDSTYN